MQPVAADLRRAVDQSIAVACGNSADGGARVFVVRGQQPIHRTAADTLSRTRCRLAMVWGDAPSFTPRLITTLSASRRDDSWCTNCREVIPTCASVRHSGRVLPTPSAMLSPISRQGIKPSLLVQRRIDSAAASIRFSGCHAEMNKRLTRALGIAHRTAKRIVGTIEPDPLGQTAQASATCCTTDPPATDASTHADSGAAPNSAATKQPSTAMPRSCRGVTPIAAELEIDERRDAPGPRASIIAMAKPAVTPHSQAGCSPSRRPAGPAHRAALACNARPSRSTRW